MSHEPELNMSLRKRMEALSKTWALKVIWLLWLRLFTVIDLLFSANSGTQSSYLIRFLLLPLIRSVLSNMYEMEQLLQKTEDINWTVVRPPGLKNLPATGKSRRIASWVGGVNREWRSLIQWKLSDLVGSILP